MPSPTSPFLSRPGAVPAEGHDAGVAAHYGDPMREQRRLLDGDAVVDLSHRGVVRVTGPDRLSWLHSLTTQQLTGLAPFTSAESLVLSPKGHVEHALHVVDDGERTWITVEPGEAGTLVAWLESMRFMLRVEVEDLSDQYAVLGEVDGAESTAEQLQEDGAIAWVDPWPRVVGDSVAYSDVEPHPAEGRRWRELVVPYERVEQMVGDRPLAGVWAAEAERVAAWRPRCGVDTDHRTIPHELDWLRTAVHLHKGCYRGQETVARVHNLGRPPRRVVFLHLDGSDHLLPEAGVELVPADGGRQVGRITSVARHHEDGPVALAVVKRSTPADAVLHAGDIAAAQTVVVTP